MTTLENQPEIDRLFDSLFSQAENYLKYISNSSTDFSNSKEYLIELIRRKNASEDRLDSEASRETRVEFEAMSLAVKKVLKRNARLLRQGPGDLLELRRTLERYSRRLRRKREAIWKEYLETEDESYNEVYRGIDAALEKLSGL